MIQWSGTSPEMQTNDVVKIIQDLRSQHFYYQWQKVNGLEIWRKITDYSLNFAFDDIDQ